MISSQGSSSSHLGVCGGRSAVNCHRLFLLIWRPMLYGSLKAYNGHIFRRKASLSGHPEIALPPVSALADNLFCCMILIGGLCLPITRFSRLLLSNFLPARRISVDNFHIHEFFKITRSALQTATEAGGGRCRCARAALRALGRHALFLEKWCREFAGALWESSEQSL